MANSSLPDNYLGPKGRIKLFKEEHGNDGSIETTVENVTVVADTLCVLVKATVRVKDKIIGTGMGFTAEPDGEKEVEKAETVAIGRALLHAGYPDFDDSIEVADEEKTKRSTKKSRWDRSKAKSQEAEEEADEEEEDSEAEADEESEEEEDPAPKKTSSRRAELLSKYGKKKK